MGDDMARNFATVVTAIWARGSDFRGVPSSAQRTFWVLFSQPDISACGGLSLAVGKWASLAPDTTRQSIELDIKLLVERKYVELDFETDELWVRSFMKWDRGYNNPKRLPVIMADIDALASSLLHAHATSEVHRLNSCATIPVHRSNDTQRSSMRGAYSQADTLFDTHPDRHPDRHADTQPDRHADRHPHSPVPVPEPEPVPLTHSVSESVRAPARTRTHPRTRGTRLPDPFPVTAPMREWATTNAPTCGAQDHDAFCDYWRGVPGVKGDKVDWVATWRNWMRREQERRTARGSANGTRASTTDAKVAGTLALAEQLEAAEQREIEQ